MTEIPQKGCALVTGSGGRLGRLLRAAHRTAATTQRRFVFQSRSPGSDVRWSPGMSSAVLPRCEALIALWGVTGGQAEALRANTKLVETGITLAQEIGARRMIHLSSAAVYGPGTQMNEDHPTGQTGAYGQAKCDMEAAVAQHQGQNDITHICLRLGNVVGADSLAPALKGEVSARVDQFPDGRGPLRSYIGATDLLAVLKALLDLPSDIWPEVLNVAAPKALPMDALLGAAGCPFDWSTAPNTAIPEATLDVARMMALLPGLIQYSTADEMIRDWKHLDRLSAT